MKRSIIAAALFAASAAIAGPPFPHAQHLADGVVADNPGVIDAILHVSPSRDAPNIVIAAHLTRANGETSGEDDLGVMRTGAPLIEVQKDGVRLGVLVQLRDARHHAIGALGIMYRYRPGDDIEAALRRSFAIRDALSAHIASRESLVDG